MIIYNVTIIIEAEIEVEWLAWMRLTHIPEVMQTGYFSSYKFCKLLVPPTENGITYCVQYFCKDITTLDKYRQDFAPALQKSHTERYKDKFVAFRSVLDILHE